MMHIYLYLYLVTYVYASFEAFTAVMFQVQVFWIVTPYIVVVGYQRFRGPCCLHRWYPTTSLRGFTTLNTWS